jgi:signal transduction histidine kinase
MASTQRVGTDSRTLLSYQKQFHTQKRLADALFGLFRTLGSALQVDRVANIGLLTLTGQLLIKCAAYFGRSGTSYRLISTVGARDPSLLHLEVPADCVEIIRLLRSRGVLELPASASHPSLRTLRLHGFRSLFPLTDGDEPLGIIALGDKIVPGALTGEDLQILDAFGVVIAVSLKNSAAFEMVEQSRNALQRLNELKHEFLSHVSHEFRTPLTILKSTIEMVDVDPEVHEMQLSALARFEHLVNTMLMLNEVNASGMQLELRTVHARELVDAHIRPMVQKHGSFALHDELPDCNVTLDLFKIGTALESLLDNAVKFGAGTQSGEVSLYLSTRERVVEARSKAGHRVRNLEAGHLRLQPPPSPHTAGTDLVIEVKDKGIGIPPEEIEAIFHPFTQAINSPTRGVKGAGLGLAMARHIVDAHGGELFCRSAIERGTVFYLAIPLRRDDGNSAGAALTLL